MDRKFAVNMSGAAACALMCFLIAENLREFQGPYFGAFHHDPDYAYFLNSATMICGGSRGMYMHPGTTVHIYGGTLLSIASWFRDEQICKDLILNSERYIQIFSRGISIIIGIGLWLTGYVVYRFEKNAFAAVIAVLVPYSVSATWKSTVGYAPEPILLVLASFCGALFLAISRNDELFETPWVVLTAAACAGAVMTKVTFAPFLLILFFLNSLGKRFLAIGLTSIFCAVLAIPIWPQISTALNWYYRLATHTGKYGAGEAGFVEASSFGQNLLEIGHSVPVLYLLLAAAGVRILLRRRLVDTTTRWEVIVAGLSAAVVVILLVAKHYAVHYLIPALCVLPCLSVAFLRGVHVKYRGTISALIAMLVIGTTFVSYQHGSAELKMLAKSNADFEILEARAKSKDCKIAEYYRTSSQTSAILFGDSFSGKVFTSTATADTPDFLNFNVFNGRFLGSSGWLSPQDAMTLTRNNLCLIGHLDLRKWKRLPFKVKHIASEGRISLFEIVRE